MITRKKGVINPPRQKEVAKERKRRRRGRGVFSAKGKKVEARW